jgi:hypothetical protein
LNEKLDKVVVFQNVIVELIGENSFQGENFYTAKLKTQEGSNYFSQPKIQFYQSYIDEINTIKEESNKYHLIQVGILSN